MKKIIIIVVALVVLAGGGVAAYLLLGSESTDVGPETAGAEAVEEELPDPIYLPLSPAFVVNFEHKGSIRYLQLTLQIMAYEQAVVDKVSANMPAVRNTLIMLFSGQDFDLLNTLEGKEQLRQQVLGSINDVVQLKDDFSVREVFFTGFVMQ